MEELEFSAENEKKGERILLTLMPFWAPLTPPLGISCLKSYLTQFGYYVKTIDANINPTLWEFHGKYLSVLDSMIPDDKKGNFHMVGYDVFMNHLMAYINYDSMKYNGLIVELVLKNFFINISNDQINRLCDVVKDFYLTFETYLLEMFEKERPSIFGVSVYNSTLAPSLFALRLMKERYPDVKTVMGGGVFADQLSQASPDFSVFIEKVSYIDTIFIGEGEILFHKWLEGELPKNQKIYSLSDINGVYMDLSKAEVPDFSDFNVKNYSQLAGYTSRSCPYQCSFCSETVQWGTYRKKEAKQVADELVSMYKKYHRQLFLLGDSLINPITSDLAKEFINRDISIYWDGYLRADKPVCDINNTILWRRGGFYRARLGIESGSPNVLKLMNKNITPEQIKAALISLAQAGIKTTTYWVIGHPGETEKDFQETLDLVEMLKVYIYEADFHPFFFYPTGQVNSSKWAMEGGVDLLYPKEYSDILITQTWKLDVNPTRDIIYERVCRFAEHCKKHSIPNPYSLKDINEADQRWKALHRNAVPTLVELNDGEKYFYENKEVGIPQMCKLIDEDEGDFIF